MDTNTTVADQNTERLIQTAYQPEAVPPGFVADMEKLLTATAQGLAQQRTTTVPAPRHNWRWAAIVLGGVAACGLIAYAVANYAQSPVNPVDPKQPQKNIEQPMANVQPPAPLARWTEDVRDGMQPRIRPDAPQLTVLKKGGTLSTKAGKLQLVQLEDGTRLYVQEKTEVEASGDRQLTLIKGKIYLEIAPKDDAAKFVVKTGGREMTAWGTHFAVEANPNGAGVVVTQGMVSVKGDSPGLQGFHEVRAGQQISAGESKITTAPRASHSLEWTRELMAAAESPMVPGCQHAGGALVALDPRGQEIKLSLRQYHIDVHIEDGFARTTIDQTYFNTTWERLEGTFYFPLPPDASLSRLAMYVVDGQQCKLMEGGMAERKHAADVYETIRYQRRDPALLEWLDGSTFKMRVFPLEAKQEKRILLSYTQKLPSLYGNTRYRFAGGHNMPVVRDWSFTARIKSGAGMNVWSPSHESMHRIPQTGDVLMTFHERNIKPEADVVLEMQEPAAVLDQDVPRFSTFLYENHQYLMLRYRPNMPSLPERKRRDWIILFEASAGRDPLLAGTQVDVVKQLLKNAEYDDTFTLLTVNSNVRVFGEPSPVRGRVSPADSPDPLRGSARQACRPQNVDEAIKFLNKTHLVGALDLQQGLDAALKFAKDAKNPHIVHIGSGIPAIGERDAGKLAQSLPTTATYVGVGVGKRWNRSFMKAAAERTNGLFTQINPDESVAWRAFELLATLNTPRLLDVQVVDALDKSPTRFLMETSMIAQGEEICAVTRVDTNRTAMPGKVFVHGTLDGKKVKREFPVVNVLPGAGYLPRTWAKQEIDRLLAENAAKNKNEIVNLSKAMYVMSPFTSLLVLETDADYEKYKVDKGRKDHWAMYQAPPKIPLVYEPEGKVAPKVDKKVDRKDKKPSVDEVLRTVANGAQELAAFVGQASLNGHVDRLRVLGALSDEGEVLLGGLRVLNSDNFIDGESKQRMEALVRSGAMSPEEFGLMRQRGVTVTNKAGFGMGLGVNSAAGGLGAKAGRSSNGEVVDAIKLRRLADNWGRLPLGEQRKELEKLTKQLPQAHRERIEEYLSNLRVSPNDKEEKAEQKERTQRRQRLFNEWSDGFEPERLLAGAPGKRLEFGALNKLDPNGRESGITMGIEFAFDNPARLPALNFPPPPSDLAEGKKKAKAKHALSVLSLDDSESMSGRGRGFSAAGSSTANHSFRYERPAFNFDRTLFTDLVQYAPGLHTTYADILTTLEQEADVEQPKAGTIDAAARTLIDRARAADWATLAIAAQSPIPGYKIAYNGLGQFVYERVLVSGLREQVICDGKTLWHLYPEIGLTAKRAMSRHHHDLLASINPAFLPGADELARGCDVKTVDSTTIALVPFGASELKQNEKYHRLHLIFAKDGRLMERRVVEMPLGKVIYKQIYHADGAVEWKDADDKSLAKIERTIAPAQAPNLKASTNDLVVMEMPIRTRSYWLDQWTKDEKPYYVEQAIVSECVTRSGGASVMIHFGKHFHMKGDRRLGFYTLLNSANYSIDNSALPPIDRESWTIDIEQEHPQNALAMFLAQAQRELRANDQSLLKKVPGAKDGFVQKMSHFRNLWLTWQNQRPLLNGSQELPLAKSQVMDFLQETTSPTFAYAILDTMQRRCNVAPTDHMLSAVEKRFGPISDPLGLGYIFRYEHARTLWQTGIGAEAGKRFRELHAEALKFGVLPPIDPAFRDALNMPIEGTSKFIASTRKAAEELLEKKQYRLAFQMAKQMEQLGDEALAEEILSTILTKASAEDRESLTIVCVGFLAQKKNFIHADRLLAKLLEDKKNAELAELWRWRFTLAKDAGQTATSIACLEKALDLEYADLPELVNLESFRTDYGMLLGHYQKIAEASASLEKSATKLFLAKVIRTADRWRLVDPESSQPSLLAGKILHTMGERELAWDYWTTPIDLHPAESRPWLELAETMKTEGDLEKADRAFAIAFEAEATNPEILWKRAQNAVRMGQPDRARQLYRQIADSDWQERFQATVEQARGLAGN